MRLRTDLAAVALVLATGAAAGCVDEDGDKQQKSCDDMPGVVCTWAGTGKLALGLVGQAPSETSLYWPVDVTFSELGTYVLDWNNHRVLRLAEDDTFEVVIGTDFVGDGPDDLSDQMAPGAPG